ncbi:unnamed protein product, partial [Polarella glacialis]
MAPLSRPSAPAFLVTVFIEIGRGCPDSARVQTKADTFERNHSDNTVRSKAVASNRSSPRAGLQWGCDVANLVDNCPMYGDVPPMSRKLVGFYPRASDLWFDAGADVSHVIFHRVFPAVSAHGCIMTNIGVKPFFGGTEFGTKAGGVESAKVNGEMVASEGPPAGPDQLEGNAPGEADSMPGVLAGMCFFGRRSARPRTMPVDYSRFDHIGDSDSDGEATGAVPRAPVAEPQPAPPDEVMEDLEDYFQRLDARRAEAEEAEARAGLGLGPGTGEAFEPPSVERFEEADLAALAPSASSARSSECSICLAW